MFSGDDALLHVVRGELEGRLSAMPRWTAA
jgi:hypothetical protein